VHCGEGIIFRPLGIIYVPQERLGLAELKFKKKGKWELYSKTARDKFGISKDWNPWSSRHKDVDSFRFTGRVVELLNISDSVRIQKKVCLSFGTRTSLNQCLASRGTTT
jgi:hypothetical protein